MTSAAKNKGAWIAFYFAALMQSRKWGRMTAGQQAAYMNLLGAQFDGGPLPDDLDELAYLATKNTVDLTPDIFIEKLWRAPLTLCFESTPLGLENPRMAHELELSGLRSKKARAAAIARWDAKGGDSDANALREHSTSNAQAMLDGKVSNAIQTKQTNKAKQTKQSVKPPVVDAFATALEADDHPTWLLEVLATYRDHRIELKGKRQGKLTASGWKAKAKELAAMGEAPARACVALSVSNGWLGLFPEKVQQASSQAPSRGGRYTGAKLKDAEARSFRWRLLNKIIGETQNPDVTEEEAFTVLRARGCPEMHDYDWKVGYRNDPPPIQHKLNGHQPKIIEIPEEDLF